MVPIYRPANRPSDAILDAEAKILEAEGVYHCNGIYFASQADASIARRVEAERRVREAARARECVWCRQPIADGETYMQIAGCNLHDPKCTRQFDEWAYGEDQNAQPDLRIVKQLAATLPDSTPVIWEGESTTYGELSQTERMCCEPNQDGMLEGGYPL